MPLCPGNYMLLRFYAAPDGMTKISLLNVTEEILLNLWLIKIDDVFKLSLFDLLSELLWLWAPM